jgi:hypothetical protein
MLNFTPPAAASFSSFSLSRPEIHPDELTDEKIEYFQNCFKIPIKPSRANAEPNKALISMMLLITTCVIALLLKRFRGSDFFPSYVGDVYLFILFDCLKYIWY